MTVEKLPFNYTFEDVNPRYRLLHQVCVIFQEALTDRSPPVLKLLSILKQKFCTACSLIAINESHGQSDTLDIILSHLREHQNSDNDFKDYVAGFNSDTNETFLSLALPKSVSETLGESYAIVMWRKGRLFTPEDVIIARTALIVFFAKYEEYAKGLSNEPSQIEDLMSLLTTGSAAEGRPLTAMALSRLYEEALDMVCKVVVITEMDGALLHLNRAATILFKRSLEGSEKDHGGIDWVAGLLHPDDVSKLVSVWNDAQADTKGFHVAFRLQMGDNGLYHLFDCFARPVKIAESQSDHNWIFVMYDTEQQRLMEETRQAASRKTKFLAEMSHEIRTPLACVIGTCSLLSYTPLNREQSELLNTIRVSSQQLFTLTNNILDLAKIEESKLILESRVVSLERLLSDVIDIFVPDLARKDVDVALNICFPEVAEMIKSDEGRLRQIMTNILSNAIKFTVDHSTITIHVRKVDAECTSKPQTPKLLFEIADEGPGIPDSVPQSQLFDTFIQLDASTSRKYGGSGLGLTISKKLVNLLGGEIWYESAVGKGTKMCFTIELKEPSQIELADPSVSAVAPSSFRLLYALREFLSTLRSSQPITLAILVRKPKMADFLVRLFRKAENQLNICLIDQGALDNENYLIAELIKHEPTIVISDALRHTEAMKRAIKEKICKAVIFLDDQNDKFDLAEDRQFRSMRKPVKPGALVKSVHECLLGVLTAHDTAGTVEAAQVAERAPQTSTSQSRWLSTPASELTPKYARTSPSSGTASFASTYPLHLMLAEDNLLNQQLMTRILAKYGYVDVVVADNGRQAIEAFAKLANEDKTRIDAIFMDMQMPEIEGPEATHLIRTFCRQTGSKQPHVMALTAKAFSEDRAECLRSGMCTYLSKPIRWPTLEEELVHAFQASHDKVKCVCNEERITEENREESASEAIGRSTGLDI